ncbi:MULTISPECIES: Na/Pi cotransporter family protein [unclassified Ensifer]|uniref:Na/Pi cotransporter family protein n=1 Tax=unclassified Ensifer TaxID=2633371 RepID=UPI000890C7DF|nr:MULTISPECIES: Na/Pi cotransporter family protein [unclassified Ensifer]MBD9595006.1 Na/Pi cotransporter family protein [Ensifer sp. ENS05]SDM96900.1 phosphate:Na+ symporter [Ensifer sp. YR511]
MSTAIVSINLFGAVALLLFGLGQVRDGMQRAFGARLKAGLAAGTRDGLRSFFSGLVATIALQSSTATALMVASFVERDLIVPRMAQIVLLGANVGTAMTAWIVALGLGWLSPLLLLCGFVVGRGSSSTRKGSGAALVGIGLMLLSLHLIGGATEPLRTSAALSAFFGMLDNAWPVALVISAGLAALASSSLTVVVLILSLATSASLSTGPLIALVLGANLGGAVPPVLATFKAAASARRVALGNLIVRAVGCLAALALAGYIAPHIDWSPVSRGNLPVDVHLAFNLALALLAAPLARPLSRLTMRLLPDEPKATDGPLFLEQNDLGTPVAALAGASREVLGVGDLVERMLVEANDALQQTDPSRLAAISTLEGRVDRVQHEIKVYVSRVGQSEIAEEQRRHAMDIVDYAINLEHIGDIIEKGLLAELAKKIARGLAFSSDGQEELSRLFAITIDNLRMAQAVFATRDNAMARRLVEAKEDVRRLERQSAERHLQRLRDGRAESIETSSLHLDMLRDLKRINAHIATVAHPILDQSGLLIDSRIRPAAT